MSGPVPAGVDSEPMPEAAARKIAAEHRDDPDKTVLLFPTLDALISDEHEPIDALRAIRILLESCTDAMRKAMIHDLDPDSDDQEQFGPTARGIESALLAAYGAEPLALARVLTQFVIDRVIREAGPDDEDGDPDDDDDDPSAGQDFDFSPREPTDG